MANDILWPMECTVKALESQNFLFWTTFYTVLEGTTLEMHSQSTREPELFFLQVVDLLNVGDKSNTLVLMCTLKMRLDSAHAP